MKTINILAPKNCVMSSLLGVIDFVDFCNGFWRYQHPDNQNKLLDCQIYSLDGNEIEGSNGVTIKAKGLSDYEPADAVFLVSVFANGKDNIQQFTQQCAVANDILVQEHQAEKWIATYCTGTFGLAQSGLLNDAPATTVWWMQNVFSEFFPRVQLRMDELVVEHNKVITGGATTSYFNVCMTLLEKLTNDIFARQMSKFFLLDKQRLSQQPFIDSSFVINKHDQLVEDIQDWMLQHYPESFSLESLCDKFAVSKRTLIRRFKNACGDTPFNYLQKIRVEKAKHYLESSNLSLEQIVNKIGYEDTASFRKLFSSLTQLSPKNYRQRFGYNHHEVLMSS